jgi:parallel beta-helix repeat protein
MPSVSFGNDISHNHIHDIGKGVLSDMGGIYTLGVSTGTRLTHNLIHGIDARHYGGWGLYNDEGSTGILLEDNVVYDTKFSGYHMHYGRECIVRNNIFGGGRIDQLARTRRMAHISFYFYNNIVYWTQGKLHSGNWDDPDDYDFVFHPDHVRKLRKTTECDWNLYFNPNMKRKDVRFGPDLAWEEWQARGEDVHSVWADPKFANPAAYDFTLPPDSPAFKLGFRPIDLSAVGPR